ncbi:twin-arginine translocation signal domain-containing protein [Flaviflexus salsibiostraticola]|uniref:Twin-arginine translocation signal domain-containing protein n=1 Tax=Flaviflexus salsibiostraticola TaxID=1282737 RepID=A0A3Q8WU47_9ACTO|nr:DMSO/selenate family reductase complex A subunit [Flaviflexus salsibiostraticola]AZN30150.1 twin-arginine translocation signal domain-containing protein [Flaviflexus salsibiostraticola]
MTIVEAGGRRGLSRRSFMKWSGVAGGSAALVATAAHLGMPSTVANAAEGVEDADATVWSACTVNCGSRCPLRLQVKDGTVVRVLPDNTGDNELGNQQVRACVRGRSQRHRIYNPDRLKKPMKRVPGTKRGDEQWEEISWEQALDEIAEKMEDIKGRYGNEAFYIQYGTGVLGTVMSSSWPPDQSPLARMLNYYGGYLDHYSDYSTAGITQAYPYFYGTWLSSNSFDDAKNSKLQVMFGNNPLETRMGGASQLFVTQKTKEISGVRTIVIDPRYSETAAVLGDEWIGLRPGTDAALIAGMIHVMLEEDLQDQDFLDKYCVGFDEDTLPEGAPKNSSYRSYIEGKGTDGVEKTPEWAADITGVPAQKIRQLAREIANAKPAAITQGWGSQRHANGENTARAIFLLAAVTGNIGVAGGGTGARESAQGLGISSPFYSEMKPNASNKIISVFGWMDAIEHGPELNTFNAGVCEKVAPGVRANKVPVDDEGNPTNISLEVPIKALFQYGSNSLVNQTGDNNRTVKILQDESLAELIVTCDIQYTVSARYSDYILPGTSTAEETDIHPGEGSGPMAYGIVSTQAIDPLYECKSMYDICTELADRLGIKDEFTGGKTREEWLQATIDASREADPELPTYEEWKEMGIYRRNAGPIVSAADFREDPEANPLPTPSGKIEIYSSRLAAMAEKWEFGVFRPELEGDKLTALPEYTEVWEGVHEARTSEKYPLQVIGHHYKARTHSSYGNVDWMKEAHTQSVWINPVDAAERGIKNDDEVFVYNERGTVRLPAKVTERIVPGALSIPQGAWYDPKTDVKAPSGANLDLPVDIAGSVNTLTSHHPSPLAKGNAVHTTIANVVKA